MTTPLTAAQQDLVLKNKGLIGAAIRRERLFDYGNTWDDLFQEGFLGLMRAAQLHDPDSGFFAPYAYQWIRGFLFQYLQRQGGLSRAMDMRKKCFKINSLERQMSHELGREPSPAELAERLGVTEFQVQQELAFRKGSINIDDIDVVDSSSEERNGFLEFFSDMAEKFYDTLTNERDRAVWREHILNPAPMSLRGIGSQLGISGEMVRQIEKRLMRVFTIRVKATLWEEEQ